MFSGRLIVHKNDDDGVPILGVMTNTNDMGFMPHKLLSEEFDCSTDRNSAHRNT